MVVLLLMLINNSIKNKFIILQIVFISICSISFAQNLNKQLAFSFFKKGIEFENNGDNFSAFKNYTKAKKTYESLLLKDSVAKCNLELFNLLITQDSLNYDPKRYLDDAYKQALQINDTGLIVKIKFKYAHYFFDINNTQPAAYYYKSIFKLTNDKKIKGTVYANLALLYTKKHADSAKYFFEKTLTTYDTEHKDQLFSTYINYANFFKEKNEYQEGIKQLQKAALITPTKYQLKYKQILYKKFASFYKQVNEYKKAFEYLKKHNTIKDSINYTKQNIAISNLDKKYKTAEKDKQIIISESKRKQNQNLFIGALFLLAFTGAVYYLSIKNSRKKRLLAENQRELAKQKNITLVKEQEIIAINAMVNGQEKERIRIAEDLHDNIGSVLATLKMHFENLKLNKDKKHFDQEKLYQKTESLIDETYLKVRSMAHAKNAGVIANKGLLTAVKIMAEKISDANQIIIEVLDFGLDQPIENTLELTVFRIIQELTTNIIKHAEATNASINLSLYDDNLNIIIEDNGKGFNKAHINANQDGMGITSIQTRIKHLNGSFDIDSTINKGTSVIINVPL